MFFSNSPDRFASLVLDRSAETPGDSAESHTICEAKEGEKNPMTISYLFQPPWLTGTICWQAAETSLKTDKSNREDTGNFQVRW